MRLWPTSPLEFASPLGNLALFELSRICAVPMVEALRKTMRASYSRTWPVTVSMTRTPETRSRLASYNTLSTVALVTSVSLPVARAAGKDSLYVLKEPLKLQPRAHYSHACHRPRPLVARGTYATRVTVSCPSEYSLSNPAFRTSSP